MTNIRKNIIKGDKSKQIIATIILKTNFSQFAILTDFKNFIKNIFNITCNTTAKINAKIRKGKMLKKVLEIIVTMFPFA